MEKSEFVAVLGGAVKSRQIFTSLLLVWDGEKLSLVKRKSDHFKFGSGMLHTVTYATYLLYQLGISFSATHTGHANLSEYVDCLWVLLWAIYYVWGVVIYCGYCLKTPELLAFLHGLAHMSAYVSAGIPGSKTRFRNILRMIPFTFNVMCVCFIFCSGFMGVMLAAKPEFISSLFASHKSSWLVLMCVFIFEIYSVGVVVGAISFTAVYQSLYMILSCKWMHNIQVNGRLTTQEKLKSFQILKIFNIYFNSSHTAESFLTSLGSFFVGIIGTFFGAMRLHFIPSFIEYMLFPLAFVCLIIVFAVLMYGSASVYSRSCKLVYLQRSQYTATATNGRIATRQLKQLQPFGVKVGTFGIVKQHSLLLVYGALSNYSASLLIALPHRYFSTVSCQ